MTFFIRKYLRKISITAVFFLVFSLTFITPAHAESGVPSTISYQGHLSDSGGNLLGGSGTPYYFKFSFWDSPTVGSGTKLWPSSSPTATSLTVRQGVFSVNIGDVANGYPDTLDYDFNSNKNVYLQVEISSDNSTFETLSPRSSITSSAFSKVTERVSGTAQSSFGTTTPITNSLISAITTGINQVAMTIKGLAGQVANLFNIQDSNGNSLFTVGANGNVGIGTTTPSVKLDLYGTSGSADIFRVSSSTNARLFTIGANGNVTAVSQTLDGVLTFSSNGSGSSPVIRFPNSYSAVEGIWNDVNNGITFVSGGNSVQIHTGNVYVPGIAGLGYQWKSGASVVGYLRYVSSGKLETQELGVTNLTTSGNVGIGTTSPVTKLHISQTAAASTREKILQLDVSDGGNDKFFINNGTINDGRFIPAFGGYVDSSNASASLGFQGFVSSTNDASDSSAFGILDFTAGRTTSPSDPLNGTLSNIQNRKILTIRNIDNTVNYLTIMPSGNIGIGTASPTSNLEIFDSGVVPSFKITSNAASAAASPSFSLTSGPGAGNYTIAKLLAIVGSGYAQSKLSFNVADASKVLQTRMVIDVNGNVGVGTSTPSAKLDIWGNLNIGTSSTPTLFANTSNSRVGIGTASPISMLDVNGALTVAGSGGYILSSASYGKILFGPGWGIQPSGGKWVFDGGPLNVVNGTSAFNSITTTGNVGIGKTNPSVALDVVGSIVATGPLSGTNVLGTGYLYMGAYGVTPSEHTITPRSLGSLANPVLVVEGPSGLTGNIFQTAKNGIANFVIQASGNVGIGTTTPAFPLDVYSTVSSDQTYGYLNASGLIGTSAGTNSYSIRSQGRILAPEFNAVSDARLKDVQFELDSGMALSLVTKLKPVSFKWKSDPNGQPVLGFLAQDVEQIIPNAVSKISTANFSDQRTLDYNQLISVVIGAVKDLALKIANISKWFSVGGDQLHIQGEVCVDDVCVSKDQFKQILRDSGGYVSSVEENSNVVVPTETSTTAAEETVLETTPVSEPEVVTPEVISEPVTEPTPEPTAPIDNPVTEPSL